MGGAATLRSLDWDILPGDTPVINNLAEKADCYNESNN